MAKTSVPSAKTARSLPGPIARLKRRSTRTEPQGPRPKLFARALSLQLPRVFTPDRR
jgi:hypothetical protein